MSLAITRNDLSRRSKTRLGLYMLGLIAYWYSPVVYGFWLWQDLKMGALSIDGDAIGIPLVAFVALWFVGFPFYLIAGLGIEVLMRKRDRRKRSRRKA